MLAIVLVGRSGQGWRGVRSTLLRSRFTQNGTKPSRRQQKTQCPHFRHGYPHLQIFEYLPADGIRNFENAPADGTATVR